MVERAQAAAVLQRFGLGLRPNDLARTGADPTGYLLTDLSSSDPTGMEGVVGLPSAGEAARMVVRDAETRKAERIAEKEAADRAQMAASDRENSRAAKIGIVQSIYRAEADARIRKALASEIGFVERLVWFWSNHFCVSAGKGVVMPIAGAFEREAIRPHVLGRFSDMLLAVETHPAMLYYLDNARSVGPASPWGRRRRQGINENLAREILELHTLGVRTVYTQEDIISLAKMITGWTVVPRNHERGGEFVFEADMHEPGERTLLGKTYRDAGFEQGRTALLDISRHPATARHVSTKLARHFISDDPPPALVDRLAANFLETEGNLRELAKTLIAAPEARERFRAKIRRPMEWMVAMYRLSAAAPSEIAPMLHQLTALGEPLWRPAAPNGFSDANSAWLSSLGRRLAYARRLATVVAEHVDPWTVAETALGPLGSAETRQAVARAASRSQALTLLFMAPETLRR